MRLQQQLAIIKHAVPLLGNIQFQQQQQAPHNQIAGNKVAVRAALKELTTLPYLSQLVRPLLTYHTFAVGGEEIVLDQTSFNQWHQQFPKLLSTLLLMQEALQIAVPQADTSTITIRLPETNSLDEIASIMADLQQILRPILEGPDTETQISVQGFDTGSKWVVVRLVTAFGLGVITDICNAARKILDLVLDAKRAQLSMKRIDAEVAILEQIEALAKEKQKKQRRKLAEDINKQRFQDGDNERVGRIERSIELLAKLNAAGGEVRPALEPATPLPKDEGFPDIAKILDASRKELAAAEQKLLSPAEDEKKDET